MNERFESDLMNIEFFGHCMLPASQGIHGHDLATLCKQAVLGTCTQQSVVEVWEKGEIFLSYSSRGDWDTIGHAHFADTLCCEIPADMACF